MFWTREYIIAATSGPHGLTDVAEHLPVGSMGSGVAGTAQAVSVPPNGPIYVRLWTLVNAVWQYHDYTYQLPILGGTSITSLLPTSGPVGTTVTINGNNFQASYSGGDGNDLTLTVVP